MSSADVERKRPEAGPGTAASARWQVGTALHFHWLHGIVKTVIVLNLIDGVLTLLWVWTGFAREANTLLDELVTHHPVTFVVTKLALVGLGTTVLWHRREHPVAVIGIFVSFLVYYYLLLMHMGFVGTLYRNTLGG
jgi:hypothetical protein